MAFLEANEGKDLGAQGHALIIARQVLEYRENLANELKDAS